MARRPSTIEHLTATTIVDQAGREVLAIIVSDRQRRIWQLVEGVWTMLDRDDGRRSTADFDA